MYSALSGMIVTICSIETMEFVMRALALFSAAQKLLVEVSFAQIDLDFAQIDLD